MPRRSESKSQTSAFRLVRFRPQVEHLEKRELLDAAVFPAQDPNQRLVAQLYLDLFNRDADPAGLTAWTGQLDNGALTSDVVLQLEASQEYRTQMVQSLYARYLGRSADISGLQQFVQFLGQGGSADEITAELLDSQEYFQNRSGGNNAMFVTALYHDVLGRAVDATAVQYFQQPLSNGVPRDAVVRALLSSTEATQNQVDFLYQRFLFRRPDASGLSQFAQALQQGTPSEDIIAAVAGSDEYLIRVTSQDSAISSRTLRYTDVVRKLFLDFLGRAPEPQEITDWVNRFSTATDAGHRLATPLFEFLNSSDVLQTWVAKWLQNDLGESGSLDQLTLSPEATAAVTALSQGADFADVRAGLLASDTFYQAAGGTDSGFVTRLYQTVVERPPTDDELNAAVAQLGTLSRQDVARNLLESQEAASTLVGHWFADYLGGNTPSLADIGAGQGMDFWATRLQAYADPPAVLAELLSSQEFLGFRPDLYEQPDVGWAPPPGPFAQNVAFQRGPQRTFATGDPVITTTYFYWYDVASGLNVFNADGSSAITHHPPTLDGFSYKNPDWHEKQLRDMAAAGIDVALPVSYCTPFSDPEVNDPSTLSPGLLFTDVGVPPMVMARHRLVREGVKAPSLGLFYDSTSLYDYENSKHYRVDMSTLGGKEWYYESIRNFFSHIPAEDWARIDGKVLIFLYHLGSGSGLDENLMAFIHARFLQDFGIDVYLVAPDETLAPGIAFSAASKPWVDLLQQKDALGVLGDMLASAEFYTAAGGNDGGFIDRMYDKLLDRPADPYGRASWLYTLSNVPRRQAVDQFLYSDESLRILVAGWYRRYLRRLDPLAQLAASDEITPLVQRLANRDDALIVLAHLLAGPEFYSASGGTDAALVENLYQRILERAAEPDGKAYWLNRLANVSREGMIIEFLHTNESYELLVGGWLRYYLGHYWGGRVDAEYDWGGALGPVYRDVAALGAGYDQSAARDRPTLIVPRDGGDRYRGVWTEFLAMNPRPWLVHLETWDELIEGSDLCETQEFGRLYIDLTRQYADQFHALGMRGVFAGVQG
jgi:hypothetical protein